MFALKKKIKFISHCSFYHRGYTIVGFWRFECISWKLSEFLYYLTSGNICHASCIHYCIVGTFPSWIHVYVFYINHKSSYYLTAHAILYKIISENFSAFSFNSVLINFWLHQTHDNPQLSSKFFSMFLKHLNHLETYKFLLYKLDIQSYIDVLIFVASHTINLPSISNG